MGRHERMKRGRRMEDREDRSKGIEIHITDASIIKPSSPFKLEKHETLTGNETGPIPLTTH